MTIFDVWFYSAALQPEAQIEPELVPLETIELELTEEELQEINSMILELEKESSSTEFKPLLLDSKLQEEPVDPLQEVKEEQTEFLHSFDQAVSSHDVEETLNHVDWIYKEDQLDYLYEGDSEKFLNELFCGNIVIKQEFTCLSYNDIVSVKPSKVEISDDSEFYYTDVDFVISTKDTNITTKLGIYRDENNPYLYGIYGAKG